MTNAQRIVGHWRLRSFTEQQPDGSWADALGPNANGSISYWPDGRMQVLIGAADRPRLRGEWEAIPAVDKARCLDRMVAYAGRYSVNGDQVLHHVEVCWIPNWEGRDLVRTASFPREGQVLLRTPQTVGGRPRALQEVLWERTA